MAEALAHHKASDIIEPHSAGLSPLGYIVEPTRRVLREQGIRMDRQWSKGLRDVDVDAMELIVNMTGMPGKSLFPGAAVVDWEIDDPFGEELIRYREACEAIEERLDSLIQQLRAELCGGSPESALA
jgi:protein-tyrosine-phosphatase